MIKKIIIALSALAAMGWSVAQADPIILNDWNVTEIEDSGDVVTVNISVVGGNSVLTVQWVEGSTSDDLWTAIGLDQFYFNSTAEVTSVYDSTAAVTSWTQSEGGQAGGFGRFLSWEREGGSTGGINPGYIEFTFAGTTTFGVNARGNQFAAHVRYGQDCSGFVGGPSSTTGSESDSSCGATEVPEPATLALFGLGLIGFGLARRRKS